VDLHRKGVERSLASLRFAKPAKLLEESEAGLHRRWFRGCEMRPLALHADDEAEVPLVADRDRIPAARFSDDEEVGPGQVMDQMAGPSRVALLSDRADDQDLPGQRMTARRDERRREGALRVARPSPMEAASFEADRQSSFDRVDVAEEHDPRGSATDARDRISDLIGPHIESERGGDVGEPPNGPLLVTRRTVLLHEGAEDLDVIHAGAPVLARRATAPIARP